VPHARVQHEFDGAALFLHLACLLGAAAILARARRGGPASLAA